MGFKFSINDDDSSLEVFGAGKIAEFFHHGSRGKLLSYNKLGWYFSSHLREPDSDYKMPSFANEFNVDQSRFHPAWPTIKTGDKTVKDVVWENGIDSVDLINKVKKYEHLIELFATLTLPMVSEDVRPGVAAVAINHAFSTVFTKNDLVIDGGKIKSIRLVRKNIIWPTDKWFLDTNYSIFETVKKYDVRIGKYCHDIAKVPNFKIDQSKLKVSNYGISTMNDVIDLICTLHSGISNRLYSFHSNMAIIRKKVCK